MVWLRPGRLLRDVAPLIRGATSRNHEGCTCGGAAPELNWNVLPIGAPTLLGVPDALVGEEGEAVADGLGADETQGPGVAGLAEETLAGPEYDRVDRQP